VVASSLAGAGCEGDAMRLRMDKVKGEKREKKRNRKETRKEKIK
jgi:hypothetical protein